jgi:hypothetical protein
MRWSFRFVESEMAEPHHVLLDGVAGQAIECPSTERTFRCFGLIFGTSIDRSLFQPGIREGSGLTVTGAHRG